MTHRELLISQAEAFVKTHTPSGLARITKKSPSVEELMADFVIDRFNAFFDDMKLENNDEEVG